MKALVLAPFSEKVLARLRKIMPVSYESWTETKRLYDPEELIARLNRETISILVIEADFVFEEVFQQAPALQFIGICRAGVNHVDLDTATQHGVLVVNTPGRNAQAVAEMTIGLLLALTRQIPRLHRYVKDGQWKDPVEPYIAMRGVELYGRTLGVVGLGAIGQRVARLGGALGMRVMAHDPYVGHHGKHQQTGASLVSLNRLVSHADCITLHAPPNPQNTSLLKRSHFAKMKSGSFLINVTSPTLLDQEALVEALQNGTISGAAFDVHDSHPITPSNPLLALDNVLLTPHLAGATTETVERHSLMILEDIQRFMRKRRPLRLVNPKVWSSCE